MAAVYPLFLDAYPHLADFFLGHLGGLCAMGAVVAHSVCRTILAVGVETAGEVFHVYDSFECVAELVK